MKPESLYKPIMKMLVPIGLFLALLAFVPWAIWQSQHPPRINITRTQYELALAKWESRHIEEYEITTDTHAFLGGIISLHVSDYGNKIEVLSPKPRPLTTLTEGDIEYLSRFTVEGMFEQIDTVLREEAKPLEIEGVTMGGDDGYMSHAINFNPVLGYPQRINNQPVGNYLSDSDWDERVTSLKIIKQGK